MTHVVVVWIWHSWCVSSKPFEFCCQRTRVFSIVPMIRSLNVNLLPPTIQEGTHTRDWMDPLLSVDLPKWDSCITDCSSTSLSLIWVGNDLLNSPSPPNRTTFDSVQSSLIDHHRCQYSSFVGGRSARLPCYSMLSETTSDQDTAKKIKNELLLPMSLCYIKLPLDFTKMST